MPASSVDSAALPRVLVTGFDPFDGASVNPSWQAVLQLDGTVQSGHRIVAARLPTVFGLSLRVLRELMQQHHPALVVCTGQAGGRAAVSLERVAINVDDARIPDNAGLQPVDQPVVAGGPAAYFTRLPVKAMLAALRSEGIAAEVSQTAGTFVCNHVFYGLMHLLATESRWSGVRGGFVHVPWLPEQGQPAMPAGVIAHGLRIAIAAALAHAGGGDLRLQAGALN